jgi:putative tryptophan/tyrosine transport system substrate-binding protein
VKRRQFITLLGSAAAAWPVTARAQQPAMPAIGWLGSTSPTDQAPALIIFKKGLSEIGYDEGRNAVFEFRWADGHNERLSELAADLVRRQVSVIVTVNSTPPALAAKAATWTIPIVFSLASDPVAVGLVASLNRPGGNITGVTSLNLELVPKRLELLRELLPGVHILALLINPMSPLAERTVRDANAAARALGFELHVLHASTESDFDTAFDALRKSGAGGMVIGIDPFFTSRNGQLGALTSRRQVPAIYQYPEFTAAGGLMSYGGTRTDLSRELGIYTGRILRGEKPADLPVQQATKVELTINLKTAKALGLTVPPAMLARADEVIE